MEPFKHFTLATQPNCNLAKQKATLPLCASTMFCTLNLHRSALLHHLPMDHSNLIPPSAVLQVPLP